MRFTDLIAASLVAPFVAAHGGVEGAPSIFGMPKQLRASNPFAGHQARHAAPPARSLNARQNADPERCGAANGNQVCASNKCCSASGFCGNTADHCKAPDCLLDFGPACDANKTPSGTSTRQDARTKLGSVPYGGEGIYHCTVPGTVAITYDDGPYIYTADLLKRLNDAGAKATFFITGNNNGKGAIDEKWQGVIKQMYDQGHQVASHTWSHQDLSKITKDQLYDQMVKNEMAIRNIIGKYPTYMRPPYSSCTGLCPGVMEELGYVVSYFDLDTDDYNHLTKDGIEIAKANFKEGIDTINTKSDGDRLVIGHDIHELTAVDLTTYMLAYLKEKNLKAVTMGECMGDPKENWYRDSTPAPPKSSSSATPSASVSKAATSSGPVPTPTGPTTTDGTCGTATGKGQSCIGFKAPDGLSGECCSPYGYCGHTSDHCGTGCQLGFGKCGSSGSSSSASVRASSSAAASKSNAVSSASASSTGVASSSIPVSESASRVSSGAHASSTVVGSSSAHSASASVSDKSEKHDSTSASASHASASVSASKVNHPTDVLSSGHPVSTSVHASGSSSVYETGYKAMYPSNSTAVHPYPAGTGAHHPSGPSAAYPTGSSIQTHPASSTPCTTSTGVYAASTPVNKASSFATSVVKPSSTPCTTSTAAATPTPKLSTDGKCGSANGGQTCAGYKTPWGVSMGCCCKQSGKCSADPWACSVGCDKGYGKCY